MGSRIDYREFLCASPARWTAVVQWLQNGIVPASAAAKRSYRSEHSLPPAGFSAA